MIENTYIISLLIEKLNKHISNFMKLYTILFITPIVYFLIKFSIITDIELNYFNINQIDFLIKITPLFYSIIFTLYTFVSSKMNSLSTELSHFEVEEKELSRLFNSYILYTNILDLISDFKHKKSFPKKWGLFFLIPVTVIFLLLPFCFIAYSIYSNFKYYNDCFTIIITITSIWITISTLMFNIEGNKTFD